MKTLVLEETIEPREGCHVIPGCTVMQPSGVVGRDQDADGAAPVEGSM